MARQTFPIGCIQKNEYMSWYFTTQISDRIKVKLYDSSKVYEEAAKVGKDIDVPVIMGTGLCMSGQPQIEFESDSVFKYTLSSNDIQAEDGSVIGHRFTVTGCLEKNGTESDVFFSITSSKVKERTEAVSEKEFIAGLFYKYLLLKDKYLLNYISDTRIGALCRAFDESYRLGMDYRKWYESEAVQCTSEEDDYRLILTTLMKYDEKYTGSGLEYFPYNNFMVLVFGKKIWNENKITFASCPFQNIRGILLNSTEYTNFLSSREALANVELFKEKTLTAAASHASLKSKLGMRATKGLNYKNLGIEVFAQGDDVQEEVISKSIAYAESNNASILIFPELSINENKLPFLEGKLNGLKSLKLIVGGSYYKKVGDGFTNTAPVYVNTDSGWKKAAEYNKMIPFSMGYTANVAANYNISTTEFPLDQYKLLVEDIKLDNNITILPCKDCVVGVAICRDVMDILDKHNPVHKYCDFVDVMLVISDNTGDSNMFVGVAECLARWHNCGTVYTNSVGEAQHEQTVDTYLEVSFGLYPFKKKGGSSSTSVSGDITYKLTPTINMKADMEAALGPVMIINSKGITTGDFEDEEIKNCCKIYKLKTDM